MQHRRTNTHELVKHVKQYAMDRYDTPGMGWDFVVECWTDTDIANYIEGATSKRQAVAMMRDIASALGEQRAAARCDM